MFVRPVRRLSVSPAPRVAWVDGIVCATEAVSANEGDQALMWGTARCPVSPDERAWIERSMRWFVGEFGSTPLNREVVLPTDDFFPGPYQGTEGEVRTVMDRVCIYMGVDPDRVTLEFLTNSDEELRRNSPYFGVGHYHGPAGHYRRDGDRTIVAISSSQATTPTALVATIAHELGHERLIGEYRITGYEADHEPLTDLLTAYLGLGIFTANAALSFSQNQQGWRTERLGYLDERMFGYGLAYYAWLRNESKPAWAKYLNTNPRTYLKRGLRFKRSQ